MPENKVFGQAVGGMGTEEIETLAYYCKIAVIL